jgi:inner membrane protein
MDPLSQGLLGTALVQSVTKDKKKFRDFSILGFIGAITPDLDVLIRSSTDTLLQIQYHRHFTHSLSFIPIGGALTALVFLPILKNKYSFKTIYTYTTLGYGTHALLDACTTYGTHLFWPFNNLRIAWNFISVVDLFFTLPLLILLITAYRKRSYKLARTGLLLVFSYLSFGAWQNHRAISAQSELMKMRKHLDVKRFVVHPTLLNLIVWRSIYEQENKYYIDAIRISPTGIIKVYPGGEIRKLDFNNLNYSVETTKQIKRFAKFSNNFLAFHPAKPNVIGDVRYSMVANSTLPLWGILIDENSPAKKVTYKTYRSKNKNNIFKLLRMIQGK